MASDEQGAERRSRITTKLDAAAPWRFDWRPGFALPGRFSATIDADWLRYRVQLDLAVSDNAVDCVALRLESRADTEPITSRSLREIPLAECVRLATDAALVPMERKDGEITVQLGPSEPMELPSRRPQRRIPAAWLQEAADIYLSADEHPTQAVEQLHSQAPISYSTARRWVEEARRRGLIPPTTPGRASARKEQ